MTSGAGDKGSAANVLRKAAEVVGSMHRCLVSHSARRGPTFNACLSAGTDPGSILHVNLRPVPGFSGRVKVFCYTGTGTVDGTGTIGNNRLWSRSKSQCSVYIVHSIIQKSIIPGSIPCPVLVPGSSHERKSLGLF